MNRVRQRGWGDSPTEQSWHWDSHWWRGSLEGNIILRPEKSHWPLMIRVFFAFYWKVFAWVWGERVDQTHQDIRRVTHTGGVNEGSLTSLTPERQFWRWFPHILHKSTWNQVSRWQHYVSGAKRAGGCRLFMSICQIKQKEEICQRRIQICPCNDECNEGKWGAQRNEDREDTQRISEVEKNSSQC